MGNKMDDPSVKYSEARYKEIKTEVAAMLTKIGYKLKAIPFIPMSGFLGVNLTEKGLDIQKKEMPWWSGWEVTKKKKKISGMNLFDALDLVVKPPKRDSKKPLRMPVSGVHKIKGVGDVITGRIEQGALHPNDPVGFAPTGVTGKCFTIEMHHKSVQEANTGDNVGVNVKGLPKEANKLPKVGDVMYVPTAKAPCQIREIKWKIGKKTGNAKMEGPKFIEAGEQAEVVMAPRMPCVCAAYDECKALGRMAAMDSNTLIMLGKITSVKYKDAK